MSEEKATRTPAPGMLDYIAKVGEMTLDQVILDSAQNAAVIADWEERKRIANERIRDLMVAEGMVKGNAYVREDGIGATLQTRVTKTINRTKLIAKGMDPAVIDDCTDTNESALYVTVRVPPAAKEKKG